ncbi:hypothetical protein ACEW7V_00290 [Areca yellow leaf disease phytoplasma]|uniref:hypothetical protein n=1 Tax=Areca yellow leaf disease phytoplasma TaxID=927614 RepID=UPI0035B50811
MIEGFVKQAPTGTTSQIIWVGLVFKSIDNFFWQIYKFFYPNYYKNNNSNVYPK